MILFLRIQIHLGHEDTQRYKVKECKTGVRGGEIGGRWSKGTNFQL